MKQIQKEIESWIEPYLHGKQLENEEQLQSTNPLKYFLQTTIPNNFESYAVALHSFWIKKKIPITELKELTNEDEASSEEDFERIKWKDFFQLKKKDFDLETSYKSATEFYDQFTQMNNEIYPGEGLIDKEHITSLTKIVIELYGNQEIELFYYFLATIDWESSPIYQGKISELYELIDNEELKLTPSLIYPKEKNWVVNTDYDLSFSFIGGEKQLINKLVNQNKYEIYELKY